MTAPTTDTPEWTPEALALTALLEYYQGLLTFEDYERATALAWCWQQGNVRPTPHDIEAKVSEMRTAAGFISACSQPQEFQASE